MNKIKYILISLLLLCPSSILLSFWMIENSPWHSLDPFNMILMSLSVCWLLLVSVLTFFGLDLEKSGERKKGLKWIAFFVICFTLFLLPPYANDEYWGGFHAGNGFLEEYIYGGIGYFLPISDVDDVFHEISRLLFINYVVIMTSIIIFQRWRTGKWE